MSPQDPPLTYRTVYYLWGRDRKKTEVGRDLYVRAERAAGVRPMNEALDGFPALSAFAGDEFGGFIICTVA